MAFPTNLTLLDNYNRANGTLGANWTNGIYSGEQLQITSNRITNVSGWGSATWNVSSFGPDTEHIATIGSAGTFEIAYRVTNWATSSPNGYFWHFENSGTTNVQLWKMTSGSQANIGATQAVTFSATDKVGVQVIGNTHNIYKQTGGAGAWNLIATRSDSSHTAAGRIGYLINGAALDDMTGGSVVSFPVNGVIDAFGSAPGSNYSVIDATGFIFGSSSGQIVASGGAYSSMYYNPTKFGPNCEAYITYNGSGAAYGAVAARIQSPGGTNTWDGYSVSWDSSNIYINEVTNASATVKATIAQVINAGDKVGIRCMGSNIQAWTDQGAGWILLGQVTDTTWTDAGYIGVELYDPQADEPMDDFGGGNLGAVMRDLRITGDSGGTTDSVTRNLRTQGEDTSNATRNVRVTAQDTTAITREVRVIAQDASAVTRDVRVTAQADQNTTRNFRVQGQADESTTRNVRIIGELSQATTRDLRVTGELSSATTRDLRITGVAVGSDAKTVDFRITAQDSTSTTREIRVQGTDTTSTTRSLRATAQDSTATTREVRITGQEFSNTTRAVRVTGELSDLVIRNMRVIGELSQSRIVELRITAQNSSSVIANIKVQGQDSASVTRVFQIIGASSANEAQRDIRLTGQATSFTVRDLRVTGTLADAITRAIFVSGQNTDAVNRQIAVTGLATDAVARAMRIAGAGVGLDAVERGMFVIGTNFFIKPIRKSTHGGLRSPKVRGRVRTYK